MTDEDELIAVNELVRNTKYRYASKYGRGYLFLIDELGNEKQLMWANEDVLKSETLRMFARTSSQKRLCAWLFVNREYFHNSPNMAFHDTTKEQKAMKQSDNSLYNAAAIVRDDVTTLAGIFTGPNSTNKAYTFKVTWELAKQLDVDDLVLVDTQNGIQVVQVFRIDEESTIELEDGIAYKWAFQKVDREPLNELLKQEERLVHQLKTRRKMSHREQIARQLGFDNPADITKALTGPDK